MESLLCDWLKVAEQAARPKVVMETCAPPPYHSPLPYRHDGQFCWGLCAAFKA